ncbi:MBL fold metallo-hydrolase [Desmospora profundinema]|uniref:L-ascorbate metabolism protein UlaG (Beta-lactamase superfamily) n=1 Tax=Desmospora profundinema TaxID=1571184 RepID=A0ABU1IQ50_9BACL|nr:MBL fold metallo-hydrolase [Desmospora profundinema]MDR6226910.1 L-ascorbate metabolism protein UlaG (beta-lactamase superfamily) [Desmospora profundinema]
MLGLMIMVGVSLLFMIGGLTWLIWSYRRKLPHPDWREIRNHPDVTGFRDDAITVTWVGHATVYLNVKGIRILTDPVFSERVGIQLLPRWTLGPKRFTPPALDGKSVGEVDLILLSHAHMDHLDLPSLRTLARPETRVVMPRGTKGLLRSYPFGEVIELDENESVDLGAGLTVTAFPVRHWGNRYPWNNDYGYTGYLIEKDGRRIAFPGDTAYTPKLKQLRLFGPLDLMLVPIGAYAPDSFQRSHCTPEQAWQMAQEAGARHVVPIHWNTFVLSQEPVDEPLRRLVAAAGPKEDRIVIREQGEVWQLTESHGPDGIEKELQLQG